MLEQLGLQFNPRPGMLFSGPAELKLYSLQATRVGSAVGFGSIDARMFQYKIPIALGHASPEATISGVNATSGLPRVYPVT